MEKSNYSVKEMIKVINSGKHLVKPAVRPKPLPCKLDINKNKEGFKIIKKPPIKEDDSLSESSSDDMSDEESSDEDEELGRYINIPEIVDEVKSFLREEENYCRSLQDLVENYIKTIKTDKIDVYDVFGCVDIIYTYHNNTFLPALKSSKNVLKIADCFIMHKKLFNMYYDNYFKVKPNIVVILKENENIFKDALPEPQYKEYEDILLTYINDRVREYRDFLQSMKDILVKSMDVGNFEKALEIINDLEKYSCKKDETTRFVISELVQTERIYGERLEKIVTEMTPSLENLIKRRSIKLDSVVGAAPDIYIGQQRFYGSLKKCLYEFNPEEVAECFLDSKDYFNLYVKDQQLKNLEVIEQCKQLLWEDGKSYDFHTPLNRLYKHKLLLQELRKSCEKADLPFNKVEEAINMVFGVISKMNGVAAINSIKDENIDISNQGELVLRDGFVMQNTFLKCNAMVFLFEKCVIITQAKIEGSRKNRRDVFLYVSHIIAKYLALNVCQDSPTNFKIQFYGKYSKMTYTLQAKDKSTKDAWVKALGDILMKQFAEEKQKSVLGSS